MNVTTITAVALALLVVGAGAVAAIPGHAADQAQDRTSDDANGQARGQGAGNSGDAGPPATGAGTRVTTRPNAVARPRTCPARSRTT